MGGGPLEPCAEELCDPLGATGLPETALLERMKQREAEVTDRFLVNFVEHQISRIEVSFFFLRCLLGEFRDTNCVLLLTCEKQTCISTLAIRNMIRPFKDGMLSQACPMDDILTQVSASLAELAELRRQADFDMAPS